MALEILISFTVATIVILVIPGPTILLVVTEAVAHGNRSVAPLAAGVLFGDFTAMTLSLLGLGALLSASAALFGIFKWIGALYLICLGIKLWVAAPQTVPAEPDPPATDVRALFTRSYIVTALNPKSIAFFVAFLPQFVDPARPVLLQLIVLGGIFLVLATINAALYARFAGHLSTALRKSTVRRWFNRCGGSALIGAGILTAGMQRSG